MKDSADKLSNDEKSSLQAKVDDLKKAVQSDNFDEIRAKQEVLQKDLYAVSEKLYKAAGQQAQAGLPQQNQNQGSGTAGASDD